MTATEKPSVKKFSGLTMALIILCAVFIASTIGLTAYYVPLTNSQNSKISGLNSQIGNLTGIVNLQKTLVAANNQTVSQGNGEYSNFSLSASYAGFVVVQVLSSTVSGTWVEASWSIHGLNYYQAYTGSHAISAGNSAVFPVLPSTITIGVGNGLSIPSSGATETITITYFY
jgi:hypothetical protein